MITRIDAEIVTITLVAYVRLHHRDATSRLNINAVCVNSISLRLKKIATILKFGPILAKF